MRVFIENSKSSTCGFDFTIFRVVEGDQSNVVDSSISWQASQLGAQGSQKPRPKLAAFELR